MFRMEILIFSIKSAVYLILYMHINLMCICFGNCMKFQSTSIQQLLIFCIIYDWTLDLILMH